jgi:FMN phosphatase YigB (HAD superfamily)
MIDSAIGLDIDGVLADFGSAVHSRARAMGFASSDHAWDLGLSRRDFESVMADAWQDADFWRALKPYPTAAASLCFVPRVYLTARPISNAVTSLWLAQHGFPAPERCLSVGDPRKKVAAARALRLTTFVDDKPETVQALAEAGLISYLYDQPWNRSFAYPLRLTDLSRLQPDGSLLPG